MNGLYIGDMRCNGLKQPLGVDCKNFTFSWKVKGSGKNIKLIGYELWLSKFPEMEEHIPLICISKESPYPLADVETVLEEKTKYYWRVRVLAEAEHKGKFWLPWSKVCFFETALADENSWKAQWIEAGDAFYKEAADLYRQFGLMEMSEGAAMPPLFYKQVEICRPVKKARCYVSAHGLYRLSMNGHTIGKYAMTPDFTPYDQCIYYQTYDVGAYFVQGKNHINAAVGDGWYAGHAQGIGGSNHLYGTRPALIFQMEIEYEDGTGEIVASDDSFLAFTGQLLYADIMNGEIYACDVPEKSFKTVAVNSSRKVLTPQKGSGVEVVEEVEAVSVRALSEDTCIVDFGRVLTGREKLYLENNEGCTIKIFHGEALDENGDLLDLMARLKNHAQTDVVYMGKRSSFVYEPEFSFQGYRYIKITGLKTIPTVSMCKTHVLSSALSRTGRFACSSPELFLLTENVYHSQQSNMLSIPTDCPHRERAGFTGDAQIFSTTAPWNQDVSLFFSRWLEQCRLEQLERGQIPIVVPYTKEYIQVSPNPGWTSAGWSDGIIFIPWNMYQAYGDIRFLRDNYAAMERWMAYATACAQDTMPLRFENDFRKRMVQKYLWNTGNHFGDWLIPVKVDDEMTRQGIKEISASLYYFREVMTMEKIASVLGFKERCGYYAALGEKIKQAFEITYITEDHRLAADVQGVYVMALAFGIVDGSIACDFAKRLAWLVEKSGFHLQTGFLSTPHLLDVLCDYGFKEHATKVLWQDTCPSWLYEVKMGATSIWEAWDAVDENGKASSASLNHYAFGAVCDFIYRRICGIRPLTPGFEKIRIYPELINRLEWSDMAYETVFGLLNVHWEKNRNRLDYKLTIPHGVRAVIENNGQTLEVGSGQWRITGNVIEFVKNI